jgi:hypothetical protein
MSTATASTHAVSVITRTEAQKEALIAFQDNASGENFRKLAQQFPHITSEALSYLVFRMYGDRQDTRTAYGLLARSLHGRPHHASGRLFGPPRYITPAILSLAMDPDHVPTELEIAFARTHAAYPSGPLRTGTLARKRSVDTEDSMLRYVSREADLTQPPTAQRAASPPCYVIPPAATRTRAPAPAPAPREAQLDLVGRLGQLAQDAMQHLLSLILKHDVPSDRLRVFARRARLLQQLSSKPELMDQFADQCSELVPA